MGTPEDCPALVCVAITIVAMTVAATETLPSSKVYQTNPAPSDLLSRFIAQHEELQSYKYVSYIALVAVYIAAASNLESDTLIFRRNGKPVVLNGQSLSLAGVVGVARYGTSVALDDAPETRERMARSRSVLVGKVQAAKSVYGVSTGLGGSGTCSHSTLVSRASCNLTTRSPDVTTTIITFFTSTSNPAPQKYTDLLSTNRSGYADE